MRFLTYWLQAVTVVTFLACQNQSGSTPVHPQDSLVDEKQVTSDSAGSVEELLTKVDSLSVLVGQMLRSDIVKEDLTMLTDEDRRFTYSQVDLNGDGREEIFVAMKGRYFCGSGGCTVFLLDSSLKKINRFTIVSGPIKISNTQNKGWSSLIVPSSGRFYKVTFDGKQYPGNPSVQPEVKNVEQSSTFTILKEDAPVYQF